MSYRDDVTIILDKQDAAVDAVTQVLTADRDKYKTLYENAIKPPPAPVPPAPAKGYSTKFGLGGGNTVRNGVELDRRYYGAGDLVKAVSDMSSNESKGIISWESFKFPHPWADMAKGAGDDWAKTLFKALSETVKPIVDDPDNVDEMWLSLHHEPENDQPDENQWRITQDRLSHLVPGGVDGPIKYFLTTTGWGQEFNAGRVAQEVDWGHLFPVSAPIYGIAYDAPYNTYGYEWSKGVKTTKLNSSWTDPNVYVDAVARQASRFGVEAALGEWGISDEAFAKDKTWLDKVMDRCMYNPYKRLRGAAYFDTSLNSSRSWTLGPTGSQKRLYVKGLMDARKGK